MGKVKALMMEAEDMLVDCRTNKGMTNVQALKHIMKNLGHMAYDHAQDVLKKWNDKDVDGELTVK